MDASALRPAASGPDALPGPAPVDVHLVVSPLVGWGLQRLLLAAGAPFRLAGVSWSLAEAAAPAELLAQQVVVLDLDDHASLAEVRAFCARRPVRLLALTSQRTARLSGDLLLAGARGVLHQRCAPAALLDGIRHVAAGGVLPAPPVEREAPHLAGPAGAGLLTPRERQVAQAVSRDLGAPLKVIAHRLGISEHTLRNHLGAVYGKLGVDGRLGLVAASQGRAGAAGGR